jgi:fatty acid desaturase
VSEHARPDRERRSVTQLLATAIPFAVFWYLPYRSPEVGYWLTLILAVPTTGFTMRLFTIQHDRGHGSFFHSRRARDILRFWIGMLLLTNPRLPPRPFGEPDVPLSVGYPQGLDPLSGTRSVSA